METLTALPAFSIRPPSEMRIAMGRSADGASSLNGLRDQNAQPYGDQSKNQAAEGIERSLQECAAAQRGQRLPLIRRKGAVGADKSNGDQKSPRWVQAGPLGQKGQREADHHARRQVDDKGPVGKLCSQPAGHRRADPISGDGAERSAHRDVEVLLQTCSSLPRLLCCIAATIHKAFSHQALYLSSLIEV